jgi:phage tail-like protein
MATGDRNDPYRNFRFRIEIDGITQAGFNEVTFSDTTNDPAEYREGTDPPAFRTRSGLAKYGTITLKWGSTGSMDLYKWRKQVIDAGADKARKNISIILTDEEGNDKARWDIRNAWPNKYDPPGFSARGNEVAVEMIEIVHEGSKRVK